MTYSSPEYKKAAIDWLLSVGEIRTMNTNTMEFLNLCATHGVDYEASEMPNMSETSVTEGDSFTQAARAKAFNARIVPLGFADDWYAHQTVFVTSDELQEILLSHMIMGVIGAADTGDRLWKDRLATYQQQRAEQQARWAAERAEREARHAAEQAT